MGRMPLTCPLVVHEVVNAVVGVGELRVPQLRNLELVQAFTLHGNAYQATGVGDHEGDRLGSGVLGKQEQVSLVLSPLVVDHDDKLAGSQVFERLFKAA